MMTEEITDRVTKIVNPILSSDGIELVGVEYRRETRGSVLRLYIDKEGGITVDDCTRISREVGRILDVENLIDAFYTLEVSSPGLTRPLKTEKDFMKYESRLISVKTVEPIGNRRQFKGRLLRMVDKGIEIESDGEVFRIPFSSIAKANLELEF
ncbi:MAG: ribosome maturation factor RimP [Thermodesulfobacteriota bacterium]|nr:ribosome maturation factor RimP [Thermodesulfobacteriota bacterium]